MMKIDPEKNLATHCVELADELYTYLTRLRTTGPDFDQYDVQREKDHVAKKINALVVEGWSRGAMAGKQHAVSNR